VQKKFLRLLAIIGVKLASFSWLERVPHRLTSPFFGGRTTFIIAPVQTLASLDHIGLIGRRHLANSESLYRS
jgi:hypothetical protein